ncbi:MAG TPA: DUF1194 domain-containing protein [Stellaceae bacterium]|nr:DUF1194 domain-containing protein [Stellaceae bacterium]
MRFIAALIVIPALFCVIGELRAADVDLQVILATDVSRSIDATEFALQRKGYAAALSDPRVLAAIRRQPHHAIGVCVIEFSGTEDQKIVIDWTRLADAKDAGAIAAALVSAPRSFMGRTSISAAIDFAARHFAAAEWHGARRVLDISGDGTSNSGRPITEARDDAVKHGITINGLAILNNRADLGFSTHTHPPGGLPFYYRHNVIGGPAAFLVVVKDFNSFAEAMTKKLTREIDVAARGRILPGRTGNRAVPREPEPEDRPGTPAALP